MKKKGFTLVELLAVIAILAILVIIALPNVIDLFNDAKKNSFANEIRELYKQSESQWAIDSYDISKAGTTHYYSNISGTFAVSSVTYKCVPLKMSGRQNINYMIIRDSSGKVTKVIASDGVYKYEKSATDIKITDIANTDITEGTIAVKCNQNGK